MGGTFEAHQMQTNARTTVRHISSHDCMESRLSSGKGAAESVPDRGHIWEGSAPSKVIRK